MSIDMVVWVGSGHALEGDDFPQAIVSLGGIHHKIGYKPDKFGEKTQNGADVAIAAEGVYLSAFYDYKDVVFMTGDTDFIKCFGPIYKAGIQRICVLRHNKSRSKRVGNMGLYK